MPPSRATPHLLAVARGYEPADRLLTGGKVFVPGTREWRSEDLAIADGKIAGCGVRDVREVVDVAGAALTPGFVDAHMHWSRPSCGWMSSSAPCCRTGRRPSQRIRTSWRTSSVFVASEHWPMPPPGSPLPSGSAHRAACRPRRSRAPVRSCSGPALGSAWPDVALQPVSLATRRPAWPCFAARLLPVLAPPAGRCSFPGPSLAFSSAYFYRRNPARPRSCRGHGELP